MACVGNGALDMLMKFTENFSFGHDEFYDKLALAGIFAVSDFLLQIQY